MLHAVVGDERAVGVHVYRQRIQLALYRTDILPAVGLQVEYLEVELPSPFVLRARRTDEAVAHNHRFVLYRSLEALLERLFLRPRLSSVAALHHPSGPVVHHPSNLEEQPQLARRHLEEHRVPACLAVERGMRVAEMLALEACRHVAAVGKHRFRLRPCACQSLYRTVCRLGTRGVYARRLSLCTAKGEHSVGGKYRLFPCIRALRLAAHPDAHVRVALLRAAEICRHKVAVVKFHNRRGVALREVGLLIDKLIIGNHGRSEVVTTFKRVLTRAYRLLLAVGKIHVCRCSHRYLHLPVEPFEVFVPA